ncbi:MAG: sugar ABC transporter permease [Ruminococcaceae bacterium]|nr:sugar ABC transporter permease [Oscillospiraceae bacterium]
MTNDVKIKAPKRRKNASLEKRKARAGWIFVLPFLIGFIVVYLPMIIDSIRYSFYHIKFITGGYELVPVGWQNYNYALFESTEYVQTLVKGLTDMVFDIPMILIFSLFMAVLLNQKMVGRAAFRAIFFVPVIASTGIMEAIDAQNTLSDYMGEASGIEDGSGESAATDIVSAMDIEVLFSGMAVGQGLVEYVVTAINNIYDIVNRSGVQMLIFLAGLQSISPAIYESVQIDGATSWETFWKITFPMISPMILVNAVYTIIDAFTTDSNVVMKFISSSEKSITNGNVITSAMAWMYFLLVIAIIALFALIFSAFVFYQRRD